MQVTHSFSVIYKTCLTITCPHQIIHNSFDLLLNIHELTSLAEIGADIFNIKSLTESVMQNN